MKKITGTRKGIGEHMLNHDHHIHAPTIAADSTRSEKPLFLGQPTIFSSISTSTKKMRAAKKRQRQNRKKGRK